MDEQDEGYRRLKADRAELRAEIKQLRRQMGKWQADFETEARDGERLRAELDQVRSVVRTGIPVDREDALAAWRRLETACQI